MVKRILCIVVAVCVFFSFIPLTVFGSDVFQQGFVKISILNDGSCEYYPAKLNGEIVYMSIDDIGHITGYDVEVGDLISFVKSTQTDYVTFVDVMFEGVVEAQGKEWAIDLVYEDDEYYLPLAEMLYLLHAQWAVEDGTLFIQQLPANIADFLDINMSSLWANRTNPTDLLINGESELAHTLRSTLAAMFTDFDIFDHIDWDMTAPGYDYKVEVDEDGNANVSFEQEPEGASPFVGEQYEKALLQLSVDDEEFLKADDQTKIAELLQDSNFKQVKSSWDTMNKTMEFPAKIPETAEQLNEILDQIETASGQKPTNFFDAFGDLSGLKDVPWKNYADFLSKYKVVEIVDFIGKCVEVNEVYQRSLSWDEAFIGQMEVLTDFDNSGYNTNVTDYIKEQSRKIVDEYGDNGQTTRAVAVDKIFDFVAGLGLDATPLGLIVSLPNLGIAGASMLSEDAKTSMDSAALAYMVDCLIKTEHVALIEMARSYEDMLALCVGSGFDEDDLERLRNATMLSLRCNLRNHAFIYYLNILSNDDPNWEQTEEAQIIRTQIQEGYAAICNLMETEGYDRVLIRTDLNNIFNLDEHSIINFSEYGDVRQEFGAEIFNLGEIPENDDSVIKPYITVLDMYHTSISCKWTNCDGNGWENVGDPDNACYILWHYEKERSLSEVGYCLLDINDDGQPELFISLLDIAESGSFYDMYTIINGEAIHVVSAGERDRYNLAEDYSINNSGSSGAASSSDVNYCLDSTYGTLKVNQAVIYDGWRDSENPYFYATTDYYNEETYEINYDVLKPISNEEASALLESFPENIPLELTPFAEYISSEKTANSEDFRTVIENVQTSINYNSYSASQKEYCRGDFFEIDGKNALVLMYHVLNGTELTPGYYVGLWVENSNGTISCLTDQLIEEVGDPDDAYVTVNIRKIDGKMYLNPYVRKANGNTDISKNQYYLIGDEPVLEYNLYSEGNNYYLNQEQIDQSTFYSIQDKLNIRTYILGLDPNWSEGLPPQGYTFEELLAQLPAGTTSNDSGTNNSLTTELGLSADSAHAIVDVYVPFCQSLSDTYTSSDGSVAKQRSCLVVEFETGSPNLVVHYWIPNAYDPGQFCEAWIIYGIESGEVVELYSDENYAPTRREIDMVYDDTYGFALREEQTGGYYELIIHYPDNVTDTSMYENYNYIQLSEDGHTLRVWTISGDYVDISF